MTYQETIEYLDSLTRFGWRLGLERMRLLARQLGDPQDRIHTVHVTGTNGKGSTCEMVGRILTAAGYSAGIYASPHAFDLSERYRINGDPISHEDFARLVTAIRPPADATSADAELGRTTVFEIMTLVAFLYFLERKVDFSVLEVGLGGTHDATNIVKNPLACGLTSVSLDHTDRLGNTLVEIAQDKAGIVKPGSTLVMAADQPEVLEVIRRVCAEREATLLRVGGEIQIESKPDSEEFSVICRGRRYENLRSGLIGAFQRTNAAVAIGIADVLVERGIIIASDAVREGLAAARLPGRLDVIRRDPTVVLDGAHNPAKARALASAIRELFKYDKLVLVLGILSDHKPDNIVAELAPMAKTIIATAPDSERAASPETIADAARSHCPDVRVVPGVKHAVREGLSLCGKRDMLLVTGSFYTVGEVDRESVAR